MRPMATSTMRRRTPATASSRVVVEVVVGVLELGTTVWVRGREEEREGSLTYGVELGAETVVLSAGGDEDALRLRNLIGGVSFG